MRNKKAYIAIAIVIIGIPGYFLLIRPYNNKLNRQILTESFELGKQYLVHNQKPEGNFNYEYDFLTGELNQGDSPVRQAGALWGLSLVHRDSPSMQTYEALMRGFEFFKAISKEKDSSKLYVVYPGGYDGRTGTMALVCLAYIEFLRSTYVGQEMPEYRDLFEKYMHYLLSLRKEDGSFYGSYYRSTGEGYGEPSQYFDGESLLAMVKAAKYTDGDTLMSFILESAENMYNRYVTDARKINRDSPVTKGFYQWGSMSFLEIYTAGWDKVYAKRTIELAYWMIDVHKTLWRRKNTAYAHEGMISAWQAAKLTSNTKAMKKIGRVIDRGLYKLTGWQVQSPVENSFLRRNKTDDLLAIGGVMNCKNCPVLRIDVTQHQMHAVILALQYIYN